MYVLEGYPEFEQDVKELWHDFIEQNNFHVSKTDDDATVVVKNEKCIISLLLDIEKRIYYEFQNPKTLNSIDYITLAVYFGIYPLDLPNKEYPLTHDEWIDFYAEDDFRSICRVDLPIILDEIETYFQFVINGDFSWEASIDEWKKWCDANRKPGVPRQYMELSYKHFLQDKEGGK